MPFNVFAHLMNQGQSDPDPPNPSLDDFYAGTLGPVTDWGGGMYTSTPFYNETDIDTYPGSPQLGLAQLIALLQRGGA